MELLPIYGITSFSSSLLESFYSNKLSLHLNSHQFINAPHKHSTYIAILFIKGTGEHQIDFNSYSVAPGVVFLLNPGQVHCWKLSADAEGYVFFHSAEFYDSNFLNRKIQDFPFFYLQQNHPVVNLSHTSLQMIERLFGEINQEYAEDNPYKKAKLGSLVDLVYIDLAKLYLLNSEVAKAGSNHVRVKQLQKLIDLNFKTKKTASDYADLMNMSTRHLSRICRETVNSSTSNLITDRIVMEAKRLLINLDLTVGLVASELGYDDPSHFTRIFTKHTGVRPKVFQQKSRSFSTGPQ